MPSPGRADLRKSSIIWLIDRQSPYIKRHEKKREKVDRDFESDEVPQLKASREYMRKYINPEEFIAEQKKKIAAEKERAQRGCRSREGQRRSRQRGGFKKLTTVPIWSNAHI